MIVKKIKATTSKNKVASIRDLIDYIREPHNINPDEKILYGAGTGFLCDGHAAQREEMVALASEAARSKNPVSHYILSWKEGEQPSFEQVDEAVKIFMDELGVNGHQAIYAMHKNTDNLHVHLAINRVNPETHKVVKINRGFDIEAAHRAIARIEHVQGWERELHGRYQLLENGELGREHLDAGEQPRHVSAKSRDIEHRTGEKSAERIAIEDGAQIIKNAQTWEQLHRELAAKGMRYEKIGSGAVVIVGDVPVKASSVDRNASLAKMQKRLGQYQPAPQRQQVAKREPEPIKPDVPGWQDYIAGRKAHYAEKNAAKIALDKKHEQERKQLFERQKVHRDELLRGNWKGKGELLNVMRSVIAHEQAAEKAALKEKHQKEREQHRQQFRPYPDFEQWQRTRSPEMAEQWRHRASQPQRIEGERSEPPTPRDIRAYVPEIVGQQVHYRPRDGAGPGGGVSFVDKGKSIDIHDWRNRDSTLAALQLSAQKWGDFTVTGNDEYKAMCARLAAEHGFKITNPELQESIRQERQRIQQERAQAMKSEQLQQFEKYAEAVGAERYRVTSIKMNKDNSKMTFILDKKDGVTKGFTPQEVAQHTPEMLRLQRRGENLYYTPLSETKHHILIDDMNREKLERLVRDGYQPAVVLESSPGNYQAIITVPKLGTPHDKDVGNRLSDTLNREYGDPKLSGAIHPHRAPGYENRKPKHQREDGSYPEVRLLKAERRECGKTLELSRQIDAKYQQQATERAAQKALRVDQMASKAQTPSPELVAASGSAIDAYQRHYRDVLKRQGNVAIDLSRVDSMIAVRMRVTGFDQAAIEGAIRQCAPAVRQQDEGRNWNDYAQRTALYAFSAAGDRQVADLSKYRQQWEKLEGREPQRQQVKEQRVERVKSTGMSR